MIARSTTSPSPTWRLFKLTLAKAYDDPSSRPPRIRHDAGVRPRREGYRDLGGNLMFLSANNFFWQVVKHGQTMMKTKQWRDLGRPEAALLGVQYRGNDSGGEHRGRWLLRKAGRDGGSSRAPV